MTFVVADLDAMEEILVSVLGAKKVYDSGSDTFSLSEERFFELGDARLWVAIMKGEALPARTYNHIAFAVDEAELDDYRARILALGLELREGRSRVEGEGRSLYFYDRDNHLFELHTGTLEQRLTRYARGRQPQSMSQETGREP
jgi:catechol 2,3-dioxygenase-like lactoylglutathione lyase family enzyme